MGGVADGRTVGHGRQQRPRLRIASRGNDYNKSLKCTALVSTFQFVSLIVKIIVTLTNNAPTACSNKGSLFVLVLILVPGLQICHISHEFCFSV